MSVSAAATCPVSDAFPLRWPHLSTGERGGAVAPTVASSTSGGGRDAMALYLPAAPGDAVSPPTFAAPRPSVCGRRRPPASHLRSTVGCPLTFTGERRGYQWRGGGRSRSTGEISSQSRPGAVAWRGALQAGWELGGASFFLSVARLSFNKALQRPRASVRKVASLCGGEQETRSLAGLVQFSWVVLPTLSLQSFSKHNTLNPKQLKNTDSRFTSKTLTTPNSHAAALSSFLHSCSTSNSGR